LRRGFARTAVSDVQRQKSRNYTFPAPTRGLVLNENLAQAGRAGAQVLDNWFPTQTSARLRAGSTRIATIGAPVISMFNYATATITNLFAASDTALFDVSAVSSPTTVPTPVVTGQTSGYYSFQPFATVGGNFLYAVNGTDQPLVYDGGTWKKNDPTTQQSISATGLDPKKLHHVFAFKNRLFFIERGSMNVWYLAVDSIYGTLKQLSLAGVFQRGGSLLTGGTWSLDTGSGLDDQAVFISDQGEVAIYQGTDPSSATTWAIKGRYDITPPMGRRCLMSAGGDLLIGTRDGIVPLSEVLEKDSSALSLSAVTRTIEPAWKFDVTARGDKPWELLKWPSMNMGIVSIPPVPGIVPYCYVVNLQTGAWARYTGWSTNCLAFHRSQAFFGTPDGTIMLAENGGSDDGAIYTSTYVGLPDHLRTIGRTKQIHSARTVFVAGQPFTAQISIGADYSPDLPTPPSASSTPSGGSLWDVGLWDVAKWDGGAVKQVATRWSSIGSSGLVVLPQVQVTNGSTVAPDAELIAFDLLYEVGGVMV